MKIGEQNKQIPKLGLNGQACSVDEVEAMERKADVSLPASYKAYLLIAGRYPPSAWVGSDCTIGILTEIRKWVEELLMGQGNSLTLPPKSFVYSMHQGYQFMYFVADGGSNDPAVFYYLEGEPESVMKFERFSDLVAVLVGVSPPKE